MYTTDVFDILMYFAHIRNALIWSKIQLKCEIFLQFKITIYYVNIL